MNRFILPLLLALCIPLHLKAEIIHDIDFNNQSVGSTVSAGSSISTIASIGFGSPRVQDLVISEGNSLRLQSSGPYEQIKLNGAPSGTQRLELSYRIHAQSLEGSGYSFTVLFDTPQVRTFNFHGSVGMYTHIPFGSGGVIGNFSDNRTYEVRHLIDLTTDSWEIYIDGDLLATYDFLATEIQNIRFNISPWHATDYEGTARVYLDDISVRTDGDIGTGEVEPPTTTPFPNIRNFSSRGFVGQNDDRLIGGFAVGGSGSKRLIVTARGPSIPATVANRLENPKLTLVDSTGTVLGANSDWVFGTDATAIAQAPSGTPASPLDAALLVELHPGLYTVIVEGESGGTGIGIFEVFDLDSSTDSFLYNVSTRARVGDGDEALIGGVILDGDSVSPLPTIFRGRGPSIPISGATTLADPKISIFTGPQLLEVITDWAGSPSFISLLSDYSSLVPSHPLEAAALRSLPAGAHTVILQSETAAPGIGIVECFANP